ncbi:Aspartyl/glutamyl-tRNA(Asn/Gln) amidotransferase subunit B [Moorella thermoacetica]|uniref:Aspartyl/glutamyl-tRNA(Asn/Gln) amidotransferase subunit B n=2 Tax=Neomoorella thermoacetica TaxID=1525 RepID=A0A1D7XDH9_NEOTH|nr:Asp-tRNA(Asn)/Glu-tRNA(Gln) amidotransferase subunit GatB [Moorella thermoacetica]AOQ24975.1 Aspartyl/glutamyl-tRNA(Asn/Gln) amidotransferase subunit B [Moorella thermoacetica]OIQ08964.1 aspartyl/glutamyl-tRNA(Asn/Gln) amidotransferase subunit B [Moorella thermoacetica]TYL15483.1 Aspartyl/glutamyl-tRNA(Asn/Gln) amidotransferase subunit B [Moorella thermoacetica]GAF25199.1 Asp-tRNAAsn/Glu-tRNAGln amidotransferase B subunit [Moorella thermoacetica Y72]
MEYEAVIGLEVHAELKTASKAFCSCSTAFGGEPNTHVCPVCLGLPGVLPVINRQVVEFGLKTALALNCRVAPFCKFDRKNYYYPDLPKNYQISQYDLPLATGGYLKINVDGQERVIGITRVHMEEDAGKLVHVDGPGGGYSLVDYNRTGVPLLEIVSEPDLRSPAEARAYMEKLRAILQYLDVSDCKMEEGSLRCDANVSVRPRGSQTFGTKTEVKNMNSFRALQRALEYEIERQIAILEGGGRVEQATMAWDESRGVTTVMRTKEQAHDYRYFPEPDLVPLEIDAAWIERVRRELPELPDARCRRLMDTFGLPAYDAGVITSSRDLADYFDRVVARYPDAKVVSNWIMGDFLRLLNARNLEPGQAPVPPEELADLLELQKEGTISGKIAKQVLEEMFASGKGARQIVQEKGLVQISDTAALGKIVDEVLAANPNVVEDYRNGKEKALGFLVGQVMKATGGKANPGLVNKLLKERL